jgi:rhodanese-related sulfurtransferase
MNIRWHLFYLGIIAALLAALLWQGARLQHTAAGTAQAITAGQLYREIRSAPARFQIVDLRHPGDFEDGHLPQAINLKADALAAEAAIDRYRPTVIVSEDGDREAFGRLAREFKLAANLDGGMMQWRMSRLPEVSGLADTDAMRRGKAG